MRHAMGKPKWYVADDRECITMPTAPRKWEMKITMMACQDVSPRDTSDDPAVHTPVEKPRYVLSKVSSQAHV